MSGQFPPEDVVMQVFNATGRSIELGTQVPNKGGGPSIVVGPGTEQENLLPVWLLERTREEFQANGETTLRHATLDRSGEPLLKQVESNGGSTGYAVVVFHTPRRRGGNAHYTKGQKGAPLPGQLAYGSFHDGNEQLVAVLRRGEEVTVEQGQEKLLVSFDGVSVTVEA